MKALRMGIERYMVSMVDVRRPVPGEGSHAIDI